jgi:hypothetical protein
MIIIPEQLPIDLKLIYGYLITYFGHDYDINPVIFQHFMNEITEPAYFIFTQLYANMITNLKSSTDGRHTHLHSQCGRIQSIHSNGFLNICGLREHQHNDEHQYLAITAEQNAVLSHQAHIYEVYHTYLNNLYACVNALLDEHINLHYLIDYVELKHYKNNDFNVNHFKSRQTYQIENDETSPYYYKIYYPKLV